MMFKLDQNPNGVGLRCDVDGLFFAGEALLVRDEDNQFRPRQPDSIQKLLSATYGVDSDWASRIRSVDVVAKALNKGDMARAMTAAVLMRLPEPDDAIRIADAGVLVKAGFDQDEPRDERGRWTSGSATSNSPAGRSEAFLEPFIEPLVEPSVRPEPPIEEEPMPPPTDIVPPTMGPRNDRYASPSTNPYPDNPECVEEWKHAYKFCGELWRKGKFGKDGYKGFGWWFNQCLRGQVSQDCGGNLVLASLN